MAGQLVQFELPSRDSERAERCRSGRSRRSSSDPGMRGPAYWMGRSGEQRCGQAHSPGEGTPGVLVSLDGDDRNVSVAKLRAAGGGTEPTPSRHVGWFARCTDTGGERFRLFQRDEPAGG